MFGASFRPLGVASRKQAPCIRIGHKKEFSGESSFSLHSHFANIDSMQPILICQLLRCRLGMGGNSPWSVAHSVEKKVAPPRTRDPCWTALSFASIFAINLACKSSHIVDGKTSLVDECQNPPQAWSTSAWEICFGLIRQDQPPPPFLGENCVALSSHFSAQREAATYPAVFGSPCRL